MNEIKVYKKLTHVVLKDERVLITEKSPDDIFAWLKDNSHIMIQGEMHSKYAITSAFQVDVNDLEGFILSQTPELQAKLRAKKARLKKGRSREMDLDYAKNYVREHS